MVRMDHNAPRDRGPDIESLSQQAMEMGYATVPQKPTPAMIGHAIQIADVTPSQAFSIYVAILAAANGK